MASTKDISVRSRARARRFGYKVEPKQILPNGVVKKCVDTRLIPDHTPVGLWMLRLSRNATRISYFHGEERRGLHVNHQRITNVLA
jgi:hypothetical protein